MESFSERLNRLLEVRGMSVADLSRLTNIPEVSLYHYKQGLYLPKQRRTEAIANALRVTPGYLIAGEDGDPNYAVSPSTPAPPIPGFDELTEENKKIVEQYIDFLLSKQ